MAVKLRLTRLGAKKKPFYRIVAIDSHKARDSQYIEQIGIYNPVVNPKVLKIDAEKAKKWMAQGAQPTDTVRALLIQEGIIMQSNVEKKSTANKKESAVKLASQVAENPEA